LGLIVDANRAGDFSRPVSGHAVEILGRLRNRSIRIVSGGRLHDELLKTRFREILIECKRVGLLDHFEAAIVDQETEIVRALTLKSDDPHVIALIRVSGSFLIFTVDQDLIDDIASGLFFRADVRVLTPTTPTPGVKKNLQLFGG